MSARPQHGSSYRHRQVGLFPVLSLGAVAFAMYVGPTGVFRSVAILAFSVVNVFLLALRGALTVRVSDQLVEWWLGVGVLQFRVPLAAITRVEAVPVRFTSHGMPEGYYYGASMQYFVELSLSDGSCAEIDLYLSQPWPPYVLVRSQEQALIVNALWPERTQRLYERLSTWPEARRSHSAGSSR